MNEGLMKEWKNDFSWPGIETMSDVLRIVVYRECFIVGFKFIIIVGFKFIIIVGFKFIILSLDVNVLIVGFKFKSLS